VLKIRRKKFHDEHINSSKNYTGTATVAEFRPADY
jgi:hypothetical protein